MAVGQYTSDLEPGDVLGPVEYTLSPFVVREYCHAVELHQDCFQQANGGIMPPTLIHLDKLRLYRHACPKNQPTRVHIEYDATFTKPCRSAPLRVSGKVSERIEARTHLCIYPWSCVPPRRPPARLLSRYRHASYQGMRPLEVGSSCARRRAR